MKTTTFLFCLLLFISCSYSKRDNDTNKKNENIELKSTTSSVESAFNSVSENRKQLSSFNMAIGFLKRNISQDSIILMLGEPDSIGIEILEGAEGTFVQDWYYFKKGINLVVYSDNKGDKKSICSILVYKPCPYKTEKGIGIGDKASEVISVYKQYIDFSMSDSTKSIVVGSIYDGAIFKINNGLVKHIFIGSGAE